jgi:arylsulfatase A-like enzyme
MATAWAPASLFGGSAAGGRRPNILYIMADDHASHAISCYGSKINRTPNIDRIGAGGMRLTNCFCTNSICTPSRAAILTGQYSHVNGVYTLADALDPAHQNVAQLLQKAGYQTAIVGKWHLQKNPSGFDYWNILPGQGRYYDPVTITPNGNQVHKGYATDVITDFSLEWLGRRDRERPFFLLCHHKAPHRAWDPDEKHMSLYADQDVPEPDNLYDHYENRSQAAAKATLKVGENMTQNDVKEPIPKDLTGDALRKWAYQRYIKNYLRCIASVDDNVGRVLDYLDKEGLAQDTIVIYTSDQGFFLGDHGYFDKRFIYEESLRMPFLVRYPAEIKPGTVNDDMVLNIDFAPTFLEYAGGAIPSDMQGRSFRSNLAGKTPADWRTSMYYRYWMHLADHGVPAHYGIRTRRYKLAYYYGQPLGKRGAVDKPTEPEWEMFDLEKDPREMRNVYNDPQYADIVKPLKAELYRLKEMYKDTE